MKKYLQLIRLHQWVKNLFIFLPVFFGGQLSNLLLLQNTFLGFLAFSCVASCVYIINDYFDLEKDRQHPTKSQRPLASGAISIKKAFIIAIGLIFIGLAGAYFLEKMFFLVVIIYFSINLAYTTYLKRLPLLDICIIALGFLLRIFAGSAATGILLSKWLIIMTFLLALFLALAKRRDDVLLLHKKNLNLRASIRGYNLEFINAAMTLMASVLVVAYLMYSITHETNKNFTKDYTYLPTFWVVIGILRYFQITFVEEQSAEPTKILLKDRVILFVVILWLITNYLLIYL